MHHKSSSTSSSSYHHQNQNYRENRPPVYNAEDYVAGLKRFCKLTGLQLYLNNNGMNQTNGGHDQFTGVTGNYANDNANNANNNYNNGEYHDGKNNNSNNGSSVLPNNKKNKKQKSQNNHPSVNGQMSSNGNVLGTDNGINGNYNGSLDNLTLNGNGCNIQNNVGGGDMVLNLSYISFDHIKFCWIKDISLIEPRN